MNILIRPIITEKSMRDAAAGCFTFEVDKDTNKRGIAQAVAQAFKVKVLDVKTNNFRGKARRAGRRRLLIPAKAWKKAIVRLEPGQKIDLFDVGEAKNA